MPRVAGVDPETVSFDLCVLQDGEPVVEQVFETGMLSDDSAPLLAALVRNGPYDLIYGPSGYGLPLATAPNTAFFCIAVPSGASTSRPSSCPAVSTSVSMRWCRMRATWRSDRRAVRT